MTDFEFQLSDHVEVDSPHSTYGHHPGVSDHAAAEVQPPVRYGPDIDEHDYNHDGRVDVISADTDHDGTDDVWQYDTDNEGKIDMVGYDLDGDGRSTRRSTTTTATACSTSSTVTATATAPTISTTAFTIPGTRCGIGDRTPGTAASDLPVDVGGTDAGGCLDAC